MFHILMMFSVVALHLISMCSLNVRLESICPPRYLTLVDLSVDSSMTLIVLWVFLLSCCLLPKEMNSVFPSFSLSLMASILVLMSDVDLSMILMVSSSDDALLSLLVSFLWFENSPY